MHVFQNDFNRRWSIKRVIYLSRSIYDRIEKGVNNTEIDNSGGSSTCASRGDVSYKNIYEYNLQNAVYYCTYTRIKES